MALVSRSRLPLHWSGREARLRTTLSLPGKERCCERPELTVQSPPLSLKRWSVRLSGQGRRGFGPRAPSLFCSAPSSQSAPSSGTSRGEGGAGRWPRGGGCKPAGRGGPEAPAPPRHAGLPLPHCPQRLGARSRARPRPMPRRRKPGPPPPADPGRFSAAPTAPSPSPPRPAGSGAGARLTVMCGMPSAR